MKCNQPCASFQLGSPCPFSVMVSIAPQAPSKRMKINTKIILYIHVCIVMCMCVCIHVCIIMYVCVYVFGYLLVFFSLASCFFVNVIFLFSSSCRAASTDIPDPLSPLPPIIHRLQQVFKAPSRILTASVCMFELVVLLLLGHMWMSIGVHHL